MEIHSHTHCLSAMPALRQALAVLNGKWKLPILMAIRAGSSRFGEIERSVPGISGKVLAKELKDLEDHRLLQRIVHPGPPVAVSYAVLPYALTLDPIIFMLRDWGSQHLQLLEGTAPGSASAKP
ncbi:winged helix-turn-helix transcriptional regulator [Hymenobacter cellulosilyticus]|uniref:Helix-turn-helix transcriptional regulator n=1 Tax=Hymenobacter cellulosilyticus TaxID=2932248 RepID=A0A8T9Q3R0_9BACT|nr:helix-turn-helix domain-containing protein [Hymenobacter cellulosilyticus]UOQ71602.1 helix-turn-helix transcriptional regulator [Hymenobacter cellulosilyticus]